MSDLLVFAMPTARNRLRIHIYSEEKDDLLCGQFIGPTGNCTLIDVTPEWIGRADPDDAVCKTCRRIAETKLK